MNTIQRTTIFLVILVSLTISSCGPSSANPTKPNVGHWEGSSPEVEFDVTPDGKIVNLYMSIPYGGTTCDISADSFAIQQDYTIDLDLTSTQTLSIGYVNGTFYDTKVTGKYLIEMCGQSISFVPGEDKDRDWTAIWKDSEACVPGQVQNLEGTVWVGNDTGERIVYEFQKGGILKYTYSTGSFTNATWKQDGNSIYMEFNNKIFEYKGTIDCNMMTGDASRSGSTWTWDWTKK